MRSALREALIGVGVIASALSMGLEEEWFLMADRPILVTALALLCMAGGLAGALYFWSDEQLVLMGGCLAGILVGVGLFRLWRVAWWIGFLVLSGLLIYNWQGGASVHRWFWSVALWVYFVFVFRDFQ